MKRFMGIMGVAAILGIGLGNMPMDVMAQMQSPVPSPTDDKGKDKIKKPGMPRVDDERNQDKKKDDRGGR